MEEAVLLDEVQGKKLIKKNIFFSWIKKNVIIEIICFLLMLNFFYEGVYKLAHFGDWRFWITEQPLIKSIGGLLKYVVPIAEIVFSILLALPSKRKVALYSIISMQILFILWVMSVYLLTAYLFWPYHAIWDKPTWMGKMSFGLVLSWLAYWVIYLIGKQKVKNILSK